MSTGRQRCFLVGLTHQPSPIETGAAANKQPVPAQALGRAVGKDLLRALPGFQQALGMVFFMLGFPGEWRGRGVLRARMLGFAGACRIHPQWLIRHPTVLQNEPDEWH